MTFEIGNLRLSDTATTGLTGAEGINNAAKSALARSQMWKEGMKDVYDIYPMTDPSCSSESYKLFGDGYFLTNDTMVWFWDQLKASNENNEDIRFNLRLNN